jgi:hypothetical protein
LPNFLDSHLFFGSNNKFSQAFPSCEHQFSSANSKCEQPVQIENALPAVDFGSFRFKTVTKQLVFLLLPAVFSFFFINLAKGIGNCAAGNFNKNAQI